MSTSTPTTQANTTNNTHTWSPSNYNTHASFVYSSTFTTPVLELLNAKLGEKIVDFGCGTGELTKVLEDIVAPGGVDEKGEGKGGIVVGVDSSAEMIQKANHNGLQNLIVDDVQSLKLPLAPSSSSVSSPSLSYPATGTYDAVFTNAALHWCKRDPDGVISAAYKLLRPGGRFVGEMGGFGNVVGIRSALHVALAKRGYDPANLDPWYFPSVEEYALRLKSHSFTPTHVSLTPRITYLPGELKAWLRTFAYTSMLGTLPESEREEVMEEVQKVCEVDCREPGGERRWIVMYVRLRFVAIKEDIQGVASA